MSVFRSIRSLGLIMLFSFAVPVFLKAQLPKYVTTLPRPDVKWGIPSEVLVSPDNRYLLVSYDYNPTWLVLFEIDGFKKIRTYRIRNHIYLSSSYFSDDGTKMYIDVGQRLRIFTDKPKFYVYTVGETDRKIVKCRNSPKGCFYEPDLGGEHREPAVTGNDYHELIPRNGPYLYRWDLDKVEVYRKQ